MNENHILIIAIQSLALLILVATFLFDVINRRSRHHVDAALENQSIAFNKEFMETIVEVRSNPCCEDKIKITQYNIHLLAILQFFDSNIGMLRGGIPGFRKTKYESGYCLLLQSAIKCPGGIKYWEKHKILHSKKLQNIVEDLLEKYPDNPPVIYGDVLK